MAGPRITLLADNIREWILVLILRLIKSIFRFAWRHPFITIPTLAITALITQLGGWSTTFAGFTLALNVISSILTFFWPWGLFILAIGFLLILGFDIPGQTKDMIGKLYRRIRNHFSWDLPWEKAGSPTMRGYWLRSRWAKACKRADLVGNREFRNKAPDILELHGTANGLAGTIDMRETGKTADYFVEHTDRLSSALGRVKVIARAMSANIVSCRFQWHDPLAHIVTHIDPTSDETRIPYGINEDGRPVTISPYFSTLVAGLTGSGKSSLVWSYLRGLLNNNVPFVLTIIDPKSGMEFRKFKADASYLYTETDYKQVLTKVYNAMVSRERWFASQGYFKLPELTIQNPLHVIIIDELMEVVNKDTEDLIRSILNRGRASGFVLWGLSQSAIKENIGSHRDFFSQRIAFATRTREMTDAVLGTGATSVGAAAHKLVIPGNEGVGFEMNENASVPVKFRALFISDDEKDEIVEQTEELLATIRASWPKAKRDGIVYKYLDKTGQYIYIGKTIRGTQRFQEHHDTKTWVKTAVSMELEHFDNECETLKREAELIFEHKPIYNTQGKNKKLEPNCDG